MSIPELCVYFAGDEISAGKGCPPGQGYVELVTNALAPRGVGVVAGTINEGQTAYFLVSEDDPHQEFKTAIRSTAESVRRLVVVLALGVHDRVLFGETPDMLEQALAVLIRDVQAVGARPVLMQIVPDGLDERVGQELGAGICPVPISLVKEYRKDAAGGQPFMPSPAAHMEMAKNLLMVLEEELQLQPSGGGHGSRGGRTRANAFATQMGPPGEPASAFDGVWVYRDQPGVQHNIQGDQIRSDNGTYTEIKVTGVAECYIVQNGFRLHGEMRRGDLHWSDGEVWTRLKESDVPTLTAPPRRRFGAGGSSPSSKPRGDVNSLLKAWEKATEAHLRSRQEVQKMELRSEKEALEREGERLRQARMALEENTRRLDKDWEEVNELNERAQNGQGGMFAWCQA